mgnify:CR=1 FL=1
MYQLNSQQCKYRIFNILTWFANFCDENDLKYYLAYGTLLGAIRHKDFIPWDDDVDVYMPRPDYEAFKILFNKKYHGTKYQLRSKLYNKVELPFEKILDMTTSIKSEMNEVDSRLWIDIFPLDGLSSCRECAVKVQNKAGRLLKYYGYASAKIGSGTTRIKALFKIPVILSFHIIGASCFTNKLKKISCSYSYEESKYIGNIAWGEGEKDIFLKSDFDDFIDVDFHGAKMHAMKDWNKYLKQIYGDYMELPPENARLGHCFEAYDLTDGD